MRKELDELLKYWLNIRLSIKYSLSILILLTPAVEVPAQLIATTEYSYTVLILSCELSVIWLVVFGPLYMDTPSRYTEYEVIDLSLDGVDQLISVLEQLMSV